MALDLEIFGQGVYSPTQAARLIGSTPHEVRRWTHGGSGLKPLWQSYYVNLDGSKDLSFLDLVELRIVKAFRSHNISLQAIRFAIQFAKEAYGVDHPLTILKFKTDGSEILAEAIEHDGELVSLSSKRPGQKVFKKIVEQSLNDLEYEDGSVARWWVSKDKTIVIDPARQFGAPLLDEYGIATKAIFDEFNSNPNLTHVANLFEIPRKVVSAALEFERSLSAKITNGESSF